MPGDGQKYKHTARRPAPVSRIQYVEAEELEVTHNASVSPLTCPLENADPSLGHFFRLHLCEAEAFPVDQRNRQSALVPD